MAGIKFIDVSFSYGDKKILENFSLDVEDSQIMCLLGPSGCGKITLMRCLLCSRRFLVLWLMNPTLEESARIAGARQSQVIWKITLPLVKPAISAGALLILISSLAHFGVPSILGFSKNIYTLPTMIYALINKSGGSFDGIRQGTALSILLVAVVAVALIIQKKVLSSGSYDIIKGKSMRPTLIKLRGAKYPLLLLACLTLLVIVVIPLVMIFLVALVRAYGLPLIWKNFSLSNYEKVFASTATMDSIKNSLFLLITAGVVCMFLGVMIAYVVNRIKPKGKNVLENVTRRAFV